MQRPQFTPLQLAEFFKTSPESIRRILKSKWQPSPEEQANRLGRWNRRKEKKVSAAIKLQSFRERSTTLRRYRTNHGFRMPWGSSEARSEKRKSYNRSGNT